VNCLYLLVQSERNVGVGEVLSIDSVTRQDGGLYVCVADNGAGSKSRDFVVDVKCSLCAVVIRLRATFTLMRTWELKNVTKEPQKFFCPLSKFHFRHALLQCIFEASTSNFKT